MTTNMARLVRTFLPLPFGVGTLVGQANILANPRTGEVAGGVLNEVYSVTSFTVNILGDPERRVRFRSDAIPTLGGLPNFLVASPAVGTTPTRVVVGPNPNVTRTLLPGRYLATLTFTTLDQAQPDSATVAVILTVRPPPQPAVGKVVNSASLQTGIAPGSLVSIFGENLGPPVLTAAYDAGGQYPATWGNTMVTFGGEAASLLFVSPGRIDAVAPRSIVGQRATSVEVSRYSQTSPALSVPVSDAAPAIFTSTPDGRGQGDILNFTFPNYTQNSTENPAAPGSAVTLFATGAGAWDEMTDMAGISLIANPFRARPLSLTIGGKPAALLYAGAAPYQSIGKLQINAIVPEDAPSGAQPIVLSIGGANNAAQQVTIAVR